MPSALSPAGGGVGPPSHRSGRPPLYGNGSAAVPRSASYGSVSQIRVSSTSTSSGGGGGGGDGHGTAGPAGPYKDAGRAVRTGRPIVSQRRRHRLFVQDGRPACRRASLPTRPAGDADDGCGGGPARPTQHSAPRRPVALTGRSAQHHSQTAGADRPVSSAPRSDGGR